MKRTDLRGPAFAAVAVACALLGAWTLRQGAPIPTDRSEATLASAPLVPGPVRARTVAERQPARTPVALEAPAAAPARVERGPEPVVASETGHATGTLRVVVSGRDADGAALGEGVVHLTDPRGYRGATPEVTAPLIATLDDGVATLEGVPNGFEYTLVLNLAGVDEPLSTRCSGPGTAGATAELTLDVDLGLRDRNEKAAIATLRNIAAAQAQLQASAAIDTDADGGGEYGYFAELAGARPMREFSRATNGARIGGPESVLSPPFLASALGDVHAAGNGGAVQRSGYYFQLHLPGAGGAGTPIAGLGEAPDGGSPPTLPDSSNSEILWCCYAWPAEALVPAHRAFFINQEGDVIEAPGIEHEYVGAAGAPRWDAAFGGPSMDASLGLAALGGVARDGNAWALTGN